jgi:hypothetical protein
MQVPPANALKAHIYVKVKTALTHMTQGRLSSQCCNQCIVCLLLQQDLICLLLHNLAGSVYRVAVDQMPGLNIKPKHSSSTATRKMLRAGNHLAQTSFLSTPAVVHSCFWVSHAALHRSC